MKVCPKCNKEPKDQTDNFCGECEGVRLVDKPVGSAPPTSAQKIMAGGDITQNVSHHSETKVYNQDETKQLKQCVVSGRNAVVTEGATCKSCEQWALNEYFNAERQICQSCLQEEFSEKENSYRSMVSEFLGDDHVLDPEERKKLDQKADELGLSTQVKNRIESEERSKDAESMGEQMTPRDKSRYKRALDAFLKKGDPKSAFSNIDGLQTAYPNSREVAELYVLIAVEADPAKGLSFINHSPIFRGDSAIKSIRLIELHESMGNENEASNEERSALRGFGDNPLVHAKALERLIDLYYEDEQQQDQAEDVKAEAATFNKPEPADDPYLHFVQAYLDNFLGNRESLAPLGEFDIAKPFLLRKQRQLKKKTKSVEADAESIAKIEKLIGQVNALNQKLEAQKAESKTAPKQIPASVPKKKETPSDEISWNGGTYKGEHSNGKPEGEGSWNHSDGRSFQGSWKNGICVSGNLKFSDGSAFKGQLDAQGKFLHGKNSYPVGDTFEGDFQNGIRSKGRYQFADGVRSYDGECNDKGQWHGQGKFTHANGSIQEGLWFEGKFQEEPAQVTNSSGPVPPIQSKSKFLAFILSVVFGPFGLFYVSNKHASWCIIIMFFVLPMLSGVMVDDNGDGGEILALVFVGTYFYGIYKATKLARSN